MDRRLWHTTPRPIERKRYFEPLTTSTALALLAAAGGTAGVGAGIGGAFGLFGKKKKKSSDGEFNYYSSPDYTKLRDVLYNVYAQGIPGVGANVKSQFNEELMPGIRELYEAKKGFGSGATPEIYALGQAGRGLERDVATQDYQARMGALNALAGITGRPVTTYEQEGPSDLENLFNFAAPIASTTMSSYLQSQDPMKKLMMEYLRNQVKPDIYGGWGKNQWENKW